MREKEPRRRRAEKPEWKDYPRRYLVRTGSGAREVEAETKAMALAGSPGVAALMGTHETQGQALKRLGWATDGGR